MLLKALAPRKQAEPASQPRLGDFLAQGFISGVHESAGRSLPRVEARLDLKDRLGSLRVRLGIRRSDYRVLPGLYALGQPDGKAPVLVTANYKLSFDHLRSSLRGRNAWILVLDTKGINVWCAAGKGSFGTEELLHRIRVSRLALHVEHRELVLPQLGATGVSAQQIYMEEKWRVLWGPVRAKDLPSYLDSANTASEAMRRVRFGILDRLVLVPNEIKAYLRPGALLGLAVLILGSIGLFQDGSPNPDSVAMPRIFAAILALAGAGFSGLVLVPALLPVLPFRAFSLKGAFLGLLLALLSLASSAGELDLGWPFALSLIIGLPAISAQLALNFTGSSTFTSLSGVEKEVRLARRPIALALGSAGLFMGLWLLGLLG